VWQFRQIQTPEDGHIGPKHVVLSESEGEKKICCITDGITYIYIYYITFHGSKVSQMTVGCGISHTITKTHIQYN
jgi:hypothetical protein